jgi:outer membrane protein OmpA-like peptidoglycan-associated protein
MGGFDLFYAKGSIDKWGTPVNFGYPVNSVKDDIYFAAKSNTKNILADAMISSDRASACCLDIFSIHKQMPLRKLTGQVVYCGSNTPAAGATVSIVDAASGQVISTGSTGSDGSYALIMDEYKALKITASSTGYKPGFLQFPAPADDEGIYVLSNPALCLSKILTPADSLHKTGNEAEDSLPASGRSFVLRNVYFDIDKSQPLASSYPSLDTLVTLLKQYPLLFIEIGGHTDSKASVEYNIKLSQARAEQVVRYLVDKGIARGRLTAKGYGESLPVAPNTNADGTDNPAGREKNRRTEFKIISK